MTVRVEDIGLSRTEEKDNFVIVSGAMTAVIILAILAVMFYLLLQQPVGRRRFPPPTEAWAEDSHNQSEVVEVGGEERISMEHHNTAERREDTPFSTPRTQRRVHRFNHSGSSRE